jgi:hypothetical protein
LLLRYLKKIFYNSVAELRKRMKMSTRCAGVRVLWTFSYRYVWRMNALLKILKNKWKNVIMITLF